MKKLYTLAAALLVGAAVSAQSLQTSQANMRYQLEALGASANMRYVTGLNVSTYGGFIWDTQSNTVSEIEGEYANCDFRCVTNDGVAYGTISNEDMVTTYSAKFGTSGQSTVVESQMSAIYGVTPDGRVAVGCLLDELWSPSACVWKGGERVMLPCPTGQECGIANDGANAQFVSADGKVIVGYLQDWLSSRPAIVWREQADGQYVADVISQGIWEESYGQGKKYLKFEPLGISENGKWICLAAQKEADGNMPTPEFMVRMNLETGEIEECETPDIPYFEAVDNIYPTSIANDGTCVGSTRDEMGFQRGAIWMAGEKKPRLLAEMFPALTELDRYDGFQHHPITISPDGRKIVGFGCPVTQDAMGETDYDFVSYLLDMDGTDGVASLQVVRPQVGSYNVAGQRVGKGARGIVVQNGRKVMK